MESPTVKRPLFLEHHESKSPVKLSGISSTNAGVKFFNSNVGSKLHDASTLRFCCKQPEPLLINELQNIQHQGNFSVAGQMKWHLDERNVLVGKQKIERRVRDAILADNSGNIIISIWAELIDQVQEYVSYDITNVITVNFNWLKLSTTASTTLKQTDKAFTIAWDDIHPTEVEHTVCCPELLSVKVNPYLVCVNNECKKKVVPYPGDSSVACKVCKRKMLIKKCDESFSCEVMLQKAEEKQLTLTIFPDVIEDFFGLTDVQLVEDALLTLENADFTYSVKKVVTKITVHCNTAQDVVSSDEVCATQGTELQQI